MAGSGSIRFSPAVHLPSPKHIAFASPGNDAGGSILAAKVAHFLAATDILSQSSAWGESSEPCRTSSTDRRVVALPHPRWQGTTERFAPLISRWCQPPVVTLPNPQPGSRARGARRGGQNPRSGHGWNIATTHLDLLRPNLRVAPAGITSSLACLNWSVALEPALSLFVGSTAKAVATDFCIRTGLHIVRDVSDGLGRLGRFSKEQPRGPDDDLDPTRLPENARWSGLAGPTIGHRPREASTQATGPSTGWIDPTRCGHDGYRSPGRLAWFKSVRPGHGSGNRAAGTVMIFVTTRYPRFARIGGMASGQFRPGRG